jgi:amidase
MACAGVQVRGARDIIPALRTTVGPLPRDGGFSYTLAPPRATALKDFRVAVWAEDPSCPVDSDVRAAVDSAVAALRGAGATVVTHPASIPVDLASSHAVFERLVYGAFSIDRSTISLRSGMSMAARLIQRPGGDAAKALRGVAQSHRTWLFADAARHEIRERWMRFFREFDVLLLPVTPTAALAHHDKDHDRWGRRIVVDGTARSYWDQVKWSALANVAGAPATTMPIATSAAGLPVGIQAMGPPGGDLTTVEFAALLTEILGGPRVPLPYQTKELNNV